jgi:fucose permease
MAVGFAAVAAFACCVAAAPWPLLLPSFLLLGVGNGIPMTGVSLFAGRAIAQRRASALTLLNFTWSAGALLAPLIAARILLHHTYRYAYAALAVAAIIAALLCALLLRDPPEAAPTPRPHGSGAALGFIAIFAFAAFLQVGVENTAAAWLSTFTLRTQHIDTVFAAASASLYWAGFLASRGLASLLLLRAHPALVFRISVAVAFFSGLTLAAAPSVALRNIAMVFLGVGLAPVFPLLLAQFFSLARHTSQSRWMLAFAGFGGSVLPWFAGFTSASAGTIRAGILVIPAAMLAILLILPIAARAVPAHHEVGS